MNTLKTILIATVALLLIYILGIVALPALMILGGLVAVFGNVLLYVVGAVVVIWIVVSIFKR